MPQNPESGRDTSDDPCDSGTYASQIQGDLSQIATTIGGKLDAKWNIQTPRRLTVWGLLSEDWKPPVSYSFTVTTRNILESIYRGNCPDVGTM